MIQEKGVEEIMSRAKRAIDYVTRHTGHVISLWETPGNNHGCRGFTVSVWVPTWDSEEGIIMGGESCASCWQRGHDDSSSPIPVGTRVSLPEKFRHAKVWSGSGAGHWENHVWVSEEKFTWGDKLRVSWENAQRWAGYSHNGGDNDIDDPQPDTTICRPDDLVVVVCHE